MTQRYPLAWPPGWPRTPAGLRKRARFSSSVVRYTPPSTSGAQGYSSRSSSDLSVHVAVKRLLAELGRMGADDSVISTNVEVRLDGTPRSSDRRPPDDPGVAVYWVDANGKTKVMAVDIYDRVADNLGAIAASLHALRAIERHGGGQVLERALTGFDALPAPDTFDALGMLGLKKGATRDEIEAKFRELAKKHHPDVGGDAGAFHAIQKAREIALGAATQ